jgi:hypothetical protein
LIQGCGFDEAALSRRDLTEVEWRILKGFVAGSMASAGGGVRPKTIETIRNTKRLYRQRNGSSACSATPRSIAPPPPIRPARRQLPWNAIHRNRAQWIKFVHAFVDAA